MRYRRQLLLLPIASTIDAAGCKFLYIEWTIGTRWLSINMYDRARRASINYNWEPQVVDSQLQLETINRQLAYCLFSWVWYIDRYCRRQSRLMILSFNRCCSPLNILKRFYRLPLPPPKYCARCLLIAIVNSQPQQIVRALYRDPMMLNACCWRVRV